MRDKVSRRNEDDRHQAERKQRRAMDNLRSYIKHLDPPVKTSDLYDTVLPRIERSEEFLALSDDELRRSAFEKYIRRLKDKEEDDERERAKRRDRASIEKSSHRDRERERDRGDRSHRNSGRHGRSSRSPEPDAYEADRRKAIADREKNYRKGAADTLLSPRRDSDRRDRDRERDRDPDRPHRGRRDDDRDRRRPDLDDERERMYRRRGDPRGSVDELPWGDDKPSASRRRRADSEIESVGSRRDSKVRRIQ